MRAAVQMHAPAAVIPFELIFLAVQSETAVGDAVGVSADERSLVAAVREAVLQRVKSADDVSAVGDAFADSARPGDEGDGEILVFQSEFADDTPVGECAEYGFFHGECSFPLSDELVFGAEPRIGLRFLISSLIVTQKNVREKPSDEKTVAELTKAPKAFIMEEKIVSKRGMT